MTNREKLRVTTLEDFLPDIRSYAERFDECIMTLLPDGRLICPWHKNCERCLEDWLNFEKGEENNMLDVADDAPTIEAEPDNRWISVKHRLPPYGERVLVVSEAFKPELGYTKYNCGVTIRDPHLNFTFWGHKVTHWQPLPEPPKIGGD